MTNKKIRRILLWVVLVPLILTSSILLLAYAKQDAIVQSQITSLNNSYRGEISVGDVHLSPFRSFPYISVKIDNVTLSESKSKKEDLILDISSVYIGFTLWDILIGNYDIQSLIIEDGAFNLDYNRGGQTNLQNALEAPSGDDEGDPINIHLHKIEITNLDFHQRQKTSKKDVETFIYSAKGGFELQGELISTHIDTEFELNVIDNGDTTYFKHKHFQLHTDLTYNKSDGFLAFKPSGITMEHGDFQLEGSIDTKKEMTLDIKIKGTKPSFDMLFAFAPTDVIPVLEKYKNEGQIYFNASLQGPTTNGRQPFINASFGAKEAYLENSKVKKRIDRMGFTGHFTNGKERNLKTMEFSISGLTANLEKGNFVGDFQVRNFQSPEIDMQVKADFDIPFIVSFLNLTEVNDAKGSVEMLFKFHDIIDVNNPENALKDLNQAYFANLKIEDLTFSSNELPARLEDLDVHLEMNGKEANLDQFDIALGHSNLSINGSLSDLPAIVHHSSIPVNAQLKIKSNLLDFKELTRYSPSDSTGINEQIKNLSLAFSFNALGNAFTEFQNLPKGEFFIDDLYADLKHYPHTLHDFHADVLVKEKDLNIVDFTGEIDESDFHLNGFIKDYDAWMGDELDGALNLDLTLKSRLLKLNNLLTYKGENYMPKDYRHEEVEDFELHMQSELHYAKNELQLVQIELDKLEGKMHVHPLRFEGFSGQFQYEKEHLLAKNLIGKMGRTRFAIDLNYYLGEDESIKIRDNSFSLTSEFIDFDALSNFNTNQEALSEGHNKQTNSGKSKHADAFNIYELPFTDMQFNIDVDHFIYHRLDLKNIIGQVRTTKNHHIYLDTISLDAAGGHISLNGHLNGSDSKHIFFEPNMHVSNVDLDKLLFKFENFGQDEIISENLHGQLTADITGKVRIYPDFVADLDQSEIHLDAKVLNGRLENYDPVMMLSEYFGDEELSKIKFDTLQNHIDVNQGKITIPNMTIESTLGHLDISGTQDISGSFDYYARIPWSLVKEAARNKIFGTNKRRADSENEIVEVDTKRRTKYLNLNISGSNTDYSIKTKKERK